MNADALNGWVNQQKKWTSHSDEYPRTIPDSEERTVARQKWEEFSDKTIDVAKDEIIQKLALGTALGTGVLYGRNYLGAAVYPAILMALGAYKLTQPLATGLLRLTESPFGKAASKAAEVLDKVKEFW